MGGPPGETMSVQLQLLSPAGRPQAVTTDLASFWAGPYAEVRKEMRAKYPKHPWPEDPASVEPTRLTNSQLRAAEGDGTGEGDQRKQGKGGKGGKKKKKKR